mmetsp:Transcript_32945/g.86953  ORF Transcript_32945/g.86953 Transcript_32945/m.86953 type:complete len:97 (-) Transcript_32945:54-344(-)
MEAREVVPLWAASSTFQPEGDAEFGRVRKATLHAMIAPPWHGPVNVLQSILTVCELVALTCGCPSRCSWSIPTAYGPTNALGEPCPAWLIATVRNE